jgi:hypothetical protein
MTMADDPGPDHSSFGGESASTDEVAETAATRRARLTGLLLMAVSALVALAILAGLWALARRLL